MPRVLQPRARDVSQNFSFGRRLETLLCNSSLFISYIVDILWKNLDFFNCTPENKNPASLEIKQLSSIDGDVYENENETCSLPRNKWSTVTFGNLSLKRTLTLYKLCSPMICNVKKDLQLFLKCIEGLLLLLCCKPFLLPCRVDTDICALPI